VNAKMSERSRTKTCRPAQLKIKTKVRAGGTDDGEPENHNETLVVHGRRAARVQASRPAQLKIKTKVHAGGTDDGEPQNHNETLVVATARRRAAR